jgi:hypothetical protein
VDPIAGILGGDVVGAGFVVEPDPPPVGVGGAVLKEAAAGTSAGSTGGNSYGDSSRARRDFFLGGSKEEEGGLLLERRFAAGETAASLSLSDRVFLPSASVGNTAVTPMGWTRGGVDLLARPGATGEPDHSNLATPHLSRWP